MAAIIDQLIQRFPDLQERLQAYSRHCERLELPAGTVLLREGAISRQAFFVEQGCLRAWFNHQGKDVTFQFCFENQGLSSSESFVKHIPSLFTIETIEPSVISVLGRTDFDALVQELSGEVPVLHEAVRLLFDRQLHYMQEFLSFIRDTPTQRYVNLMNDRPHILKRVPQHYIASYLGITPVHLSRIRAALVREGHDSGDS